MRFSLGRWRAPHLLGAWIAYWAGLGAVTLGPYVAQLRRVTQSPDAKGSVSLSVEHGDLTLRIVENGRAMSAITDAGISLLSIALLVAGPPLLLWLLWLAARPRRDVRVPGAIDAGPMRDMQADERARMPEHHER